MTSDELRGFDARLLAVADRATSYRPEYGLELQRLVSDAREHLSSGMSTATANAMVVAVEARAVTLAILDGAAGGKPAAPAPRRPATSSGLSTDVAAGSGSGAGARAPALAAAPGATVARVSSWWGGLPPTTKVAIVAGAAAAAVWAWRRWRHG